MNLIQHFVNGKIISGKSERRGKVFNPAIGEQESEVILDEDLKKAAEKKDKELLKTEKTRKIGVEFYFGLSKECGNHTK